jgi:hypothetical protein
VLPESQDQAPPQAADPKEEQGPQAPEVDLFILAREILALLKRELQLERERSGRA